MKASKGDDVEVVCFVCFLLRLAKFSVGGFSLVSLTVDFLVPLEHQVVRFLSSLCSGGHFLVGRFLCFHGDTEQFSCFLEFGVAVFTGLHLLDLGRNFLHALHDLCFVVSSVGSTLEFVFETVQIPLEGVNCFWGFLSSSTSLSWFNRCWCCLWTLCGLEHFLCCTNGGVCLLASCFLVTNDFVHLFSDFTLFAHLHDQFSNFSVQLVAGTRECLRFVVPFVTGCSVAGRFTIDQFASLFELSFEFSHSVSHLFGGKIPIFSPVWRPCTPI